MLEWNVATACCNHDCHNGLKWGLHNHFGDAQLIQDVHIGIESLRNSYMQLLQNLGPWLVGVVEFVEDPSPSERLAQVWRALGLAPDIVDLLANKLHLIFKDGRLEIHSALAGDPTLFEEVSGVLLSVEVQQVLCKQMAHNWAQLQDTISRIVDWSSFPSGLSAR